MKKRRKAARGTDPSASSGSSTYVCPSCFESVDTAPDPGGGLHQSYVEDCPLCCRPNVLDATWDEDLGAYAIYATRES
ncbi:MAG: CPXCG motif-containing cysteine-rich protein [Deltaproteobacteria bacterium]|nr:CPXCG motif-containing cysteine-rich protein [Deltaproteobacteria bacterium]